MSNWNLPTTSWDSLPEISDSWEVGNSIVAIGQLFSWPAMQALVRLNPNAQTKSWYFVSTSVLWMASQVDSQEKWEAKVEDFNTRFPNWVITFWTDCSIVAWVVQNLDDLRLLWDNQLITTEAFRQIFAEISELWKTNHRELTMEDWKRLDFWEIEMMWMIQAWIAVNCFNDETRTKLLELLTANQAIEHRVW
jgi:hypothetical protein